jgi:LacI family transcriptional regulator
VRQKTIEKVDEAIGRIGFRRDLSASLLARARDISVHFILPSGTNQFMKSLGAAISRQAINAAAERMRVRTSLVPPFDSAALAAALDNLTPDNCDCAIVVASDSRPVRQAINAAVARGVPVMTLVSDLPDTRRHLFIGIDNRAAGRTAAALMGRFLGAGAKIGLIAGSLDLSDHRQRYEGFRDVCRTEYPRLRLLGPEEGFDEPGMTSATVSSLVAEHPDLAGIYTMGAGNAGLIEALGITGRAGHIKVIAHELTEATRAALRDGSIDVVLDQNPEGEIQAALTAARAITFRADKALSDVTVAIGIFLRDNLR